jgi:hypothetical protein
MHRRALADVALEPDHPNLEALRTNLTAAEAAAWTHASCHVRHP